MPPEFPRFQGQRSLGPQRLLRRCDPCRAIQLDLSCMVDGEADAAAVRRALIHVEICAACRTFLDQVRGCLALHRDLCDPRLLMRGLRRVNGLELFTRSSIRSNLRRLSEYFYQLGKAYLLAATDERYLLQVFEEPVPIAGTEERGRGFVDGHLAAELRAQDERADATPRDFDLDAGAAYDWVKAQSLLDGHFEAREKNLLKARMLLEEALLVRPSYAEARLYLAFYYQQGGDLERAEREYRRVFETARKMRNRAHAAVQLGVLQHERGELQSAVRCFRWITRSGLVRRDGRFFFVFYNLGVLYARLEDFDRSAKCFEILYHRHRAQGSQIERFLNRADAFLCTVAERPEFAAALAQACPDWFPVRRDRDAHAPDESDPSRRTA